MVAEQQESQRNLQSEVQELDKQLTATTQNQQDVVAKLRNQTEDAKEVGGKAWAAVE